MRYISTLLLFFSLTVPAMAAERSILAVPTISSISTDFISVIEDTSQSTTFAIYGTDFGYLLEDGVAIQLGPFEATTVSGNSTGMNLTFEIDPEALTERTTDYPLIITDEGITVYTSSQEITLHNPFVGDYQRTKPKRFLNKTKHSGKTSKRQVGLNVHWSLGVDEEDDDTLTSKLSSSDTKWAREHFSYKLIMGEDEAAWLTRYDEVMLQYKEQNIRVVGMLAYSDANDEFSPPSHQQWKRFVRKVVKRYRNQVDAWEIWNEPDSADYMTPNNWKTYKPLLKYGSQMIRQYDPEAIVLNGAIADITNEEFIGKLYTYGKRYFDELNVHLYYCEEYRDDGENLGRLQTDWENLNAFVSQYRPNEKIWVTEMGCSTGQAGINDTLVRRYTKQASNLLKQYEYTRPILLYTLRDRTYLDAYEAYFGVLEENFSNKPVWRWYKALRSK